VGPSSRQVPTLSFCRWAGVVGTSGTRFCTRRYCALVRRTWYGTHLALPYSVYLADQVKCSVADWPWGGRVGGASASHFMYLRQARIHAYLYLLPRYAPYQSQ